MAGKGAEKQAGMTAPTSARKTATKKATKSATQSGSAAASVAGCAAQERSAMQERARELKAEARRGTAAAGGGAEVLAKIAEMGEPDRTKARRLHEIITATAPLLTPRTWYGMPAYALHGKVVCFFQGAGKFKSRYATLGFSDSARLDDGAMWPTSFALLQLTAAESPGSGPWWSRR